MDGADGRKSSTTATITFIQNGAVKRCTNVQFSESFADNKLVSDTIACSVHQAHTHTVSIDIYFTHLLGAQGEMTGLKTGGVVGIGECSLRPLRTNTANSEGFSCQGKFKNSFNRISAWNKT